MSTDLPKLPTLNDAVLACTEARNAAMFSYSGPIYDSDVNKFISYALAPERKRFDNICLALTTYGGDANAAYRLARFLQEFFQEIRLLVVGPCKSAGTLVSICANELAFGPFGELGPLDIQVTKKDDLMSVGSGLDTFQALAILQNQAFSAFEEYMLSILEGGQGAISTTTACEIACQLVTGIFTPITAQIDPQRMGEMQRMMSVAKAYGERLGKHNLKDGALNRLVEEYTSHSFIIDYKEARDLFKVVSRVTPVEVAVIHALQERGACVLRPSSASLFDDVSALFLEGGETEDEASTGSTPDTQTDDQRESSDPQATGGSPSDPAANGTGKRKRRGGTPMASV